MNFLKVQRLSQEGKGNMNVPQPLPASGVDKFAVQMQVKITRLKNSDTLKDTFTEESKRVAFRSIP
jgi:hypothetical protein